MSDKSALNYYEILGCSSKASYEKLKQAYHDLVLQHHPDKASELKNDATQFHQIDEAWKILRDPSLKKQYDIEFQQSELEAACKLVYARIKPAELDRTEHEDLFSYKCRCGCTYFVNAMDIVERNNEVHIPCEECTFILVIET